MLSKLKSDLLNLFISGFFLHYLPIFYCRLILIKRRNMSKINRFWHVKIKMTNSRIDKNEWIDIIPLINGIIIKVPGSTDPIKKFISLLNSLNTCIFFYQVLKIMIMKILKKQILDLSYTLILFGVILWI